MVGADGYRSMEYARKNFVFESEEEFDPDTEEKEGVIKRMKVMDERDFQEQDETSEEEYADIKVVENVQDLSSPDGNTRFQINSSRSNKHSLEDTQETKNISQTSNAGGRNKKKSQHFLIKSTLSN